MIGVSATLLKKFKSRVQINLADDDTISFFLVITEEKEMFGLKN